MAAVQGVKRRPSFLHSLLSSWFLIWNGVWPIDGTGCEEILALVMLRLKDTAFGGDENKSSEVLSSQIHSYTATVVSAV